MRWLSRATTTAALATCLGMVGCRSAMISATVVNRASAAVSLVEVDYPSASFGVQRLAPGEEYHYRFKVIGSGETQVLWSETGQDQKKSSGPDLHEGDEGTLTITFVGGAAPTWNLSLTNRRTR